MELMDWSESEGQSHRLESGTVSSLVKDPFSLNSTCFSFTSPGTLVSGLGRRKISGYFAEISVPDGSSVDNKDFDGNLSPLLLRHTPQPKGQRIKRKTTHVERSKSAEDITRKKENETNTVILDKLRKLLFSSEF